MSFERIWLIGDTHFCHRNIIKYCGRPFDSIEKMNEALISNWNKVVKRDDRVFMLGDFALCSKDKIIEIGQKLNGRKILILGNHDEASLSTYYTAGFEMVSKFPIIFQDFFILSHEPIEFLPLNTPFVNIFGHVHNDMRFPTITPRGACVSVERWNYMPVEFNQLISLIKSEDI